LTVKFCCHLTANLLLMMISSFLFRSVSHRVSTLNPYLSVSDGRSGNYVITFCYSSDHPSTSSERMEKGWNPWTFPFVPSRLKQRSVCCHPLWRFLEGFSKTRKCKRVPYFCLDIPNGIVLATHNVASRDVSIMLVIKRESVL